MDGILTMPGFDASLLRSDAHDPFSATDEANQAFVDAYTAAYGTEPNQFAADAYDGVYIVKAALEAAGCTADMSNEEICDALVSAMTSLKFTGLTGTGMTWNARVRSPRLRPLTSSRTASTSRAKFRKRKKLRPFSKAGCRERKLPAAYALFLWRKRRQVFSRLCPCFCHRRTIIPKEKREVPS